VLMQDAVAVTQPSSETNLSNLLIVEDERSMRESCREVARSLGFNTQVADSPEHAYHSLDNNPVDVVLLDLRLPGQAAWKCYARSSDAVLKPW
jgi:DNA-binding response OmpR family regulator